jgi:hypothetical protein
MAQEGMVRLLLDQKYVEQVKIESIDPEPDQEQASAEHITYVFQVTETDQPLVLTFHVEPGGFGPLSTAVRIEGGPEVKASQFVYP